MSQFPFRPIQQNFIESNRQNQSPVKTSPKQSMKPDQNDKTYRQNQKEHQEFCNHELLQKTVKAYEQTIARQKIQIQGLKSQINQNRQYTTALEQKYTILLQSIQPFDETINVQRLVHKISELENKFQAIQTGSGDTNLFKLLKKNRQSNSILTSQIGSQNLDHITFLSEKFLEQKFNQTISNKLNKTQSMVSFQENEQNNLSQKQQKIRKQSSDSDFGVQVCFTQDHNISIKKSSIEKFISLESQLKNSQINLSRRRKNSQFQENLSSLWQKMINDYLSNDDGFNTKFKQRSEYLLKKGIPYELRRTVWPMIFENQLGITWQFYMQLLERRQKGWIQESVKVQIQKDLNRSFTGKGKEIQNKGKLIDQVQQILELLHLYRPDVSYVQGMTYPAIVLTTVVGKMKAFCILANQIIAIPFFKRLYTFQGQYPSIYCKTFDFLLKDVNSGAYQMLKRKHVNSQYFLVEWFYTFFSRGLTFETTLKIWDHMAYFGEIAIFKLAVTVIEQVFSYLTDATSEEAMGLIKEFSSYIDEKKLIQAFVNSRVTEQRYKKSFKKAYKSFQD